MNGPTMHVTEVDSFELKSHQLWKTGLNDRPSRSQISTAMVVVVLHGLAYNVVN